MTLNDHNALTVYRYSFPGAHCVEVNNNTQWQKDSPGSIDFSDIQNTDHAKFAL